MFESRSDRLNSLTLIMDEIPEAVLLTDESGNIMKHNQRVEEIFHHEDLDGCPLASFLNRFGVFSSEKIGQLVGGLYAEERFAILDKNGFLREFRMRILPIPIGISMYWRLIMLVDITDFVNLQKQRDKTLAILTHDMRTPVASMLAVCRNASETKGDLINSVQKHAFSLLGMIDDFISSIRADAEQYKTEEVLIETLLDEAIYQVKELMNSRGMGIEYRSITPAFVNVDTRLMTRVLVNLLGNAIRHGKTGSQVTVQCNTTQEKDMVSITICNLVGDTSEEILLPEQKGFGMGLEFIHTVIKKHHGIISQSIPPYDASSGQVLEAKIEITLPCSLLVPM